jgi:hypothetical protein
MTDIVERLRACHGIPASDPDCCCTEAAVEIERLRADNAQLRTLLDAARICFRNRYNWDLSLISRVDAALKDTTP